MPQLAAQETTFPFTVMRPGASGPGAVGAMEALTHACPLLKTLQDELGNTANSTMLKSVIRTGGRGYMEGGLHSVLPRQLDMQVDRYFTSRDLGY